MLALLLRYARPAALLCLSCGFVMPALFGYLPLAGVGLPPGGRVFLSVH